MTTTETVPSELLNEMLAGLEGVTPGPWSVHEYTGGASAHYRMVQDQDRTLMCIECVPAATASHIARCDPDTMRSILTELLNTRARSAEPVGYQQLKDGEWQQCSEFVAKGWGDTISDGCRAIYASPAPAVPDGWVVVPAKPDEAMKAAVRANGGAQALAYALAAWPDMLAAAPPAPQPETAPDVTELEPNVFECNSCNQLIPAVRQPVQVTDGTIELRMTPIADSLPTRDELRGEQTILTYNDRVGTWDIAFMECGWDDFDNGFALGVTHWLDITSMWPGVLAQVASFRQPVQVDEAIAAGIEKAAKWVDQRLNDYVADHGSYDSSTGQTEFPDDGEYASELEEIADGIRALTAAVGGKQE